MHHRIYYNYIHLYIVTQHMDKFQMFTCILLGIQLHDCIILPTYHCSITAYQIILYL